MWLAPPLSRASNAASSVLPASCTGHNLPQHDAEDFQRLIVDGMGWTEAMGCFPELLQVALSTVGTTTFPCYALHNCIFANDRSMAATCRLCSSTPLDARAASSA